MIWRHSTPAGRPVTTGVSGSLGKTEKKSAPFCPPVNRRIGPRGAVAGRDSPQCSWRMPGAAQEVASRVEPVSDRRAPGTAPAGPETRHPPVRPFSFSPCLRASVRDLFRDRTTKLTGAASVRSAASFDRFSHRDTEPRRNHESNAEEQCPLFVSVSGRPERESGALNAPF
jgi:hypothetical protein